jgi:hypothetical protein
LRDFVEDDVDTIHRWRCDERYLEHYPGDGFDRDHTREMVEPCAGRPAVRDGAGNWPSSASTRAT